MACRFRYEGAVVGPLPVLDLSAAGFAAGAPAQLVIAPGSTLEGFELLMAGHPIWGGEATVVRGGADRVGGRFTSSLLDLRRLHLGATLDGRLSLLREQSARLPAAWRAAVADLRQLLEDARFAMQELERAETHDPLRRNDEEAELFEGLRARWGSAFYDATSELHHMSKALDERSAALGRSYATSMLLPLLAACPMHRRAYEKPLGYAGDYRMMELYFVPEPEGEGLFGRFLNSVTLNYSLVRAVRARAVVMREAARAAIDAEGDGPVRILALAAGPAIELRRLLEQVASVKRPVELILLDQDRSAHEHAHRQLSRILLEQHRGALPVTVQCLHFSVRQLLKQQTNEDERVVRETLADLDLVYAAGLYDYLADPVAASLTRLLYGRLRPGGRLLLGNLVESQDITWVMDYVLGWPLVYRTDESMLRLANGLAPNPSRVGITRDETGHCLFLDVTRATSD
jgi:extracellular factor (EF) 3-hydroxypalmitic acid methyl ester biosynthesis protein